MFGNVWTTESRSASRSGLRLKFNIRQVGDIFVLNCLIVVLTCCARSRHNAMPFSIAANENLMQSLACTERSIPEQKKTFFCTLPIRHITTIRPSVLLQRFLGFWYRIVSTFAQVFNFISQQDVKIYRKSNSLHPHPHPCGLQHSPFPIIQFPILPHSLFFISARRAANCGAKSGFSNQSAQTIEP